MKNPDSATSELCAVELATTLRFTIARLKRTMGVQARRGDLTVTQYAALTHLERDGPGTMSELARAEGIRTQSMGTALKPLEKSGLIHPTPDPNDGRRINLSLTTSGRSLIEESRGAEQDWLSKRLQTRLSDDEQKELAAAVTLLQRLVDK